MPEIDKSDGGPASGDVHVPTAGGKPRARKPRDKDGVEIIAKAEPKPLYVWRRLLNADEVIAWAKGQGFKTCLPPESMHVTVLYSKTPVDWMDMGEDWSPNEDGSITITPGGPRAVSQFNQGAVVLEFSSSWLKYRHESMIERGARSDFPEYKAHITISYQAGDVDLSNVEPFQGKLEFGPEIFEEIKGSFDPSGIVEKKVSTYFKVSGVNEGLGLVFGWAIVCKDEAGADYFDMQGDSIPEDAMVQATTAFMENSRLAKEMHAGEAKGCVVHSFPLTGEIAKAMGIETKKTGWMVAMKPTPEVLKKFADGTYSGFSIGGHRIRDEVVHG